MSEFVNRGRSSDIGESGPQRAGDAWKSSAVIASETLYPGVLEQLRGLQPVGDRAVIQSIRRAEGIPTANDGDIAQLWLLSRFDERAHDEMRGMVERGLCTPHDIAQVFFRMAELGLF